MSTVVLLGPQRHKPNLAAALQEAGIHGRMAAITAGWEEREAEVDELSDHLGGACENVALYGRAERLYQRLPELTEAQSRHRDRLQQARRLYRLRLERFGTTWLDLIRRAEDPDLVADAIASVSAEVQRLDTERFEHVRSMQRRHYAEIWERFAEPLRHARREAAAVIESAEAVGIAGGHVGVLLEMLYLFDLAPLLQARPVVGWSAGAMVLTERVIIFHDFPPQGAGNAEVLDAGLGLCPGMVALPHASTRLRVDDRARLARLAARFAPARCVTLDTGASLVLAPDLCHASGGARFIADDGHLLERVA